MIWEFHGYGGQLAVIDGPWKAIRQKVRSENPGPCKLYNLKKDPSEKVDPRILEHLIAAYEADRPRIRASRCRFTTNSPCVPESGFDPLGSRRIRISSSGDSGSLMGT